MKLFWKENGIFFIAFGSLLAVAAYFLFGQIEKGDLVIYFSNNRSDFLNSFFGLGTLLGEAYVYIIAIVVFLFISYAQLLTVILNSLLVLGLSYGLKNYFQHPRPYNYFSDVIQRMDLITFVPDVDLHISATTSFPSGHTTSAFAFYILLAFFTTKQWIKMLCLLMAVWVGLARVYQVQHFLEDISSGAILGLLIALFTYAVYSKMQTKVSGKFSFKK